MLLADELQSSIAFYGGTKREEVVCLLIAPECGVDFGPTLTGADDCNPKLPTSGTESGEPRGRLRGIGQSRRLYIDRQCKLGGDPGDAETVLVSKTMATPVRQSPPLDRPIAAAHTARRSFSVTVTTKWTDRLQQDLGPF